MKTENKIIIFIFFIGYCLLFSMIPEITIFKYIVIVLTCTLIIYIAVRESDKIGGK